MASLSRNFERLFGVFLFGARHIFYDEASTSVARPLLRERGLLRKDLASFQSNRPTDVVTHLQKLLHTTAFTTVAVKSASKEFAIPEISITEYVFRNFRKHGDRPAIVNALTGQKWTFPQTRDAIWRVASAFRRHGVQKNDMAMIISENSVEYIIAVHAFLSVGAVVSMANPQYTTNDIKSQMIDSGAKFILTSTKCYPKSLEVSRMLQGQVKKVFIVGEVEEGCVPFSNLLSDDGSFYPDNLDIDPKKQVAILPYSSGTTGLPKGVMLTHFIEVANSMQADCPAMIPEREGIVQLGVLPFYHVFAIMANIFSSLAWGQTTIVVPGFEPKLFLEAIQKYRVEMMYSVPPIILFLLKHPLVAAADLSSLKRIISAAAPLGKEIIEAFHSKQPNCCIGQGYGMTETGPGVTVNPVADSYAKPASSGTALTMTELKIVDTADRTKDCPVNQPGELCVRGPQIMLGYYNNPKATSEMIDMDGWLFTGDVAYLDEDGHLYVCDRVKELIKYKGLQVPPAELEAILSVHPDVADACVIGIPDAEAGEIPKAFVSLKKGATATGDEIEKYVAEKVAPYKKLRGGIEFIQEIPRSAAGKILRKNLRDGNMPRT